MANWPLGCFVLSPKYRVGRGSLSSEPWNKCDRLWEIIRIITIHSVFQSFFVSIFSGMPHRNKKKQVRIWKWNHILRMWKLWRLSIQKVLHTCKGKSKDKLVKEIYKAKETIFRKHNFSNGNIATHKQEHTIGRRIWGNQGKLQIQTVSVKR